MNNWPGVILFTIKDIKKGTSILTEYGENYSVSIQQHCNFKKKIKENKDEMNRIDGKLRGNTLNGNEYYSIV